MKQAKEERKHMSELTASDALIDWSEAMRKYPEIVYPLACQDMEEARELYDLRQERENNATQIQRQAHGG